jgi:hypothetical protein
MKKILLGIMVFAFIPLSAAADTAAPAYQYQQQGIFGCNQSGSYAMSVGALSAIGGTYVPVADAAVELNTGTLVYLECVLRVVTDREREAATASLLKQSTLAIQTGRGGNAQFVVSQGQELGDVGNKVFLNTVIQGTTLNTLNSALQDPVKRALATDYSTQTQAPQNILTCPYQGDLTAAMNGNYSGSLWDTIGDFENPACTYLGSYFLAQNLVYNQIAQAIQFQQNQWNWGQGYYPLVDANGNVVTPATNVNQSYQQQLNSPLFQLQSANDIGQMIGALYAGVSTQIVSDSQGLAGLTQSSGGQPSYLDQVTSQSGQGLQAAASGAGLQILTAAQQTENSYYQTVNSMGTALAQAIQQLRGAETQCWTSIAAKVCTGAASSNGTCTDASGNTLNTLKVASTTFSQPIIDSQISPFASATAADIAASQQSLALINQLIQGVSNTSSASAQSAALQQLDQLVANHSLHTPQDVQTVTLQSQTVQSTLTTLLQTTANNWGGVGSDSTNPEDLPWDGTTNPGIGWCNTNNPTTVSEWDTAWKQ